jgi:hypothetical protein
MNNLYNGKGSHIRVRHNSIRELLKNGVISLEFIKYARNFVDPLTKDLMRKLVLESSRGMVLKTLC